MNRIRSDIIIAALALGCIYLSLQLFKKSKQLSAVDKSIRLQRDSVNMIAKEISRKRDAKGLETVIFDVTRNKASPDNAGLTAAARKVMDTATKALKIQNKQLRQIMILKANLEAENLQLRKQIDTLNRPVYSYKGHDLDMTLKMPDSSGTIEITKLSANLKLNTVQFWRRSWLLGPKKQFLSIKSDNPLLKLNAVDYLEVENKAPLFQFRLQLSGSYDQRSGDLSYGPAAVLELGRFNFRGHYGKSVKDRTWSSQLSASYDVFRF